MAKHRAEPIRSENYIPLSMQFTWGLVGGGVAVALNLVVLTKIGI